MHKARFNAHRGRFLSDVTLNGRNPYVRKNYGNLLVSIIGCNDNKNENMYTTRLSYFLAVFLQSTNSLIMTKP